MHLSKKKRLKRAKATRMKIRELGVSRLTVNRTPRHIYAQVTSAEGDKVLAQASSLDKEVRDENKGNASDAAKVGGLIAQKAVALGLKKVAFDRSGYKFHGRVEALAQAAREGGLDF